ncbi:hypothetical protein AOQ84DRAFT_203102 [Glonium stellatum]|uniref:Uncharacterized protein n=1 Tax=Glonium stellatum TaxID=574774 RepID=A0A8E2F653_9PEZI|nr:hypothetical protein AOQ84DRAFT_203102 [Glonium stellatum]
MSLSSSPLSDPPASPPPELQNEALNSPPRRKRSYDDMNNNPSIKSEPHSHSSAPLKDDGSQTPTPGSPIQALTPRNSTSVRRTDSLGQSGEPKNSHEGNEETEDTEELDPAAEIESFNWAELEQRYHAVIGENNKEEQDILLEWNHLMNFFTIWAQTSQTHEVERSFQRLRTRMLHVQNSENTLEATKAHYTKVVSAFESALALLNQH